MSTDQVPAVLLFIFIAKFLNFYTMEISQTGTKCRKVMPCTTLESMDTELASDTARDRQETFVSVSHGDAWTTAITAPTKCHPCPTHQ